MGRVIWATLLAMSVLACGDDDAPTPGVDGGGGGICATDADCDDGAFCNGPETCTPLDPRADARGCAPGVELPCVMMGLACDEDRDACGGACADGDGDGVNDAACGGTDCDDADPNRYPGNAEVCDAADLDEDCDPSTFGFRDVDSDGVADAACCNGDGAGAVCGTDCDDAAPGTNPTAPEVCDGVDRDCDGTIDEGVLETFWIDGDGDGFGSAAMGAETMMGCVTPSGYADNDSDCRDDDRTISPAATEGCDAIDNNCDGTIDPGCTCTTGMSRACGMSDVGACTRGTQSCVSGMWSMCAGEIGPVLEAACDGRDEDCDGRTDEGVTILCRRDGDNDGFAPAGATTSSACTPCASRASPPGPWVATSPLVDCDDSDPARFPGAMELCDRLDSNCSTILPMGVEPNEDLDMDGHAPRSAMCSGGTLPRDDCADGDARAYLGQTRHQGTPIMGPREGTTRPFDFNCDGREDLITSTTMPAPAQCSGGPPGCSSDGYSWSGLVALCGMPVTHWICSSCGCGRLCGPPPTSMVGLPCI